MTTPASGATTPEPDAESQHTREHGLDDVAKKGARMSAATPSVPWFFQNGALKLLIQIAVGIALMGGLIYEVRDIKQAVDEIQHTTLTTAVRVERLSATLEGHLAATAKEHALYDRRLDGIEDRERRKP